MSSPAGFDLRSFKYKVILFPSSKIINTITMIVIDNALTKLYCKILSRSYIYIKSQNLNSQATKNLQSNKGQQIQFILIQDREMKFWIMYHWSNEGFVGVSSVFSSSQMLCNKETNITRKISDVTHIKVREKKNYPQWFRLYFSDIFSTMEIKLFLHSDWQS